MIAYRLGEGERLKATAQEPGYLLAQTLGRYRECRVPGFADGVIAEGEKQAIILD